MSRRSRFNLLLLEDGEHLLEEYNAALFVFAPAAAAAAAGGAGGAELQSKQRGRVRLTTRAVFFEPEDARAPVTKFPLRHAPGRPQALGALGKGAAAAALSAAVAAEGHGLSPRDAFAFQPQQALEMKAGGAVGPYRSRVFEPPDERPSPKVAAAAAARAPASSGT